MAKKKSKGVVLEPASPYGVGGYEGAKARQRRDTLMQDYEELQKEANAARSKLEVAKQKRFILSAEVRFLRGKYKDFVKTKNMNLSEECSVSAPTTLKQGKNKKGDIFGGKEVKRHRLPPLPDSRPNKKQYTRKQASPFSTSPSTVLACNEILCGGKEGIVCSLSLSSGSNHRGQMHVMNEALAPIVAPIFNRGRALALGGNGVALRLPIGNFDLNQYNNPSRQDDSLQNRAPTFDLNEVSAGDEDFQNNTEAVKFKEANISLTRGVNEEKENNFKFSICRNAGKGSSRVGKQRTLWQDPVALRV